MTENAILIRLSETKSGHWGAFCDQTTPQKVFTASWAVEAEVNNGGFIQYFYNSSNETVPFIVQALEIIGAPLTADICRRAIATAFPKGVPADPQTMSAVAAAFSPETEKQLDGMDREFFSYPHDLTHLLYTYVHQHEQDFGKVPSAEVS